MARYKSLQKKIQKYEKKIQKSRIKLKRKLYQFKNYVLRFGISTKEDFELSKPSSLNISLPCHLGIVSIGKFNLNLIQKIQHNIEQKFDSFFFNIYNLGRYKFPKEVFNKGIKRELKEIENTTELLELHPTNKIYQLLINLAKSNQLDMILAITDLPLYSSNNSNIIFLFGEAHIRHNCCVVSSLKLKEEYYNRTKNRTILELRLIKETTHELGHLIIGPEHCDNNLCVMTFSREIEGIDNKSIRFCDKCYQKLIKIREINNF